MSTSEKVVIIGQIVSWLLGLGNKVSKLPSQKYMIVGYKFVFGGVPYVIALEETGQFQIVSKFILDKEIQSKLSEIVKNIERYESQVMKPLHDLITQRGKKKNNFVFNLLSSYYEMKSVEIRYDTYELTTDDTFFPIFELLNEISNDYHRIKEIVSLAR